MIRKFLLSLALSGSAVADVTVDRWTYLGQTTNNDGYSTTVEDHFRRESGYLKCNGTFTPFSSDDTSAVISFAYADGRAPDLDYSGELGRAADLHQVDGLFLVKAAYSDGAKCLKKSTPFFRTDSVPWVAVGPLPAPRLVASVDGVSVRFTASRPALADTVLVLRFIGAKNGLDFAKVKTRVKLLAGNSVAEVRILPKPKRKAAAVTVSLRPSKKYGLSGAPVTVPLN